MAAAAGGRHLADYHLGIRISSYHSKDRDQTPPPPIEASFVELPEEKPAQKPAPVPQKTQKEPPTPKPQPRLGVNEPKPAKPVPQKGAPKNETPSALARTPPTAPKDLTAYMNETRERRRAGGIFEDEPAEPKNVERAPSEEELRMANVKRNLKEPGATGIFQITRMGMRTAAVFVPRLENG